VRILIRPRLPVLALLVLAPAIPELLTGSTPITTLAVNPLQFAIGWLGDMGLYGTGALLIREFVVRYRKGWASVLFLGAAYGIAEEGIGVHTFFEPAGLSPVGNLGWYGHAYGVNWLWALGLTIFHAVYSIALPILLTQLWFPGVKAARWLDRGAVALVAGVYLFDVSLFAFVVGHGPSPAILGLFLGLVAVLIALAFWAPADLLRARPGVRRVGLWGLAFAGTLLFVGWTVVLILSDDHGAVPAVVAAALFLALLAIALGVVLRGVGAVELDRSKFAFATGLLGALFVWDVVVEFSVPGILVVTAVFVYFVYRLHRLLRAREVSSPPVGALGARAV
jgi:hypothetical protein